MTRRSPLWSSALSPGGEGLTSGPSQRYAALDWGSEQVNERILIIDDEPSIHEVVRAYLERDGFIVYSATSGDEGLELAMSKRPQVVVLDLMLPDVSGEEICRRLRERSDVAILMLTAKSTEDQRVEGLQLGSGRYVASRSARGSWSRVSRRSYVAQEKARCPWSNCFDLTQAGLRSTAYVTRSGSLERRSS